MPLTHRQHVLRHLGLPDDTHLSLADLSKLTKLPLPALQEIYNRGTGAWKGDVSSIRLKSDFSKNPDTKRFPRSARLGKEQWSFARVYSFIDKGKTFHTADADIARRYHIV